MTLKYFCGSREKSCSNSLNAKERSFNASYLTTLSSKNTISHERNRENDIMQLIAAATFMAMQCCIAPGQTHKKKKT